PRWLRLHDGVRRAALLPAGPGVGHRLRGGRRGLPPGGRQALRPRRQLMDFRLGEEAEAVRAELRAFLDGFMTPDREEQLYRSGTSHDPEFTEAVVEHRWHGAAWAKEDGGHGRDPRVLSPIREEY